MRYLMLIAAFATSLGLPVTGQSAESPHTPQYTPAIPVQGGYTPPKPKEGFRYPDCFCTDSEGERIELGRVTCLQIGSQQVMARCAMSLNNPTWRTISQGCPSV